MKENGGNFTKPLNYLCPICNKTFTSAAALEKHQKFHVEPSQCFSCSVCSEIFEKRWLYDLHMAETHGQGGGGGACPECGEEFSQRPLLLAHIQAGVNILQMRREGKDFWLN